MIVIFLLIFYIEFQMFCEECNFNYIEKMKFKLLDYGKEIINVENIMNI